MSGRAEPMARRGIVDVGAPHTSATAAANAACVPTVIYSS
jgi:hypothetical protein